MADQPSKYPTVEDLENMRDLAEAGTLILPSQALQVLDLVDRLLQDTGPHCHVCGCTELFACDEGPGGACAWAKPGVCTHCINTQPTKEASDV